MRSTTIIEGLQRQNTSSVEEGDWAVSASFWSGPEVRGDQSIASIEKRAHDRWLSSIRENVQKNFNISRRKMSLCSVRQLSMTTRIGFDCLLHGIA